MEKKVLYDLLDKASADSKKSLNKEEQKKYRSILFEALKEEGINDENVYFITSGIIDFKENEVKEAIEKAGLTVVEINHQGEWVNITAQKN